MDKIIISTFQSVVDTIRTTKTDNNGKVKNSKDKIAKLSRGQRTKRVLFKFQCKWRHQKQGQTSSDEWEGWHWNGGNLWKQNFEN